MVILLNGMPLQDLNGISTGHDGLPCVVKAIHQSHRSPLSLHPFLIFTLLLPTVLPTILILPTVLIDEGWE